VSSGTNTLAYWAYSSVIEKMKCCIYGSRPVWLLFAQRIYIFFAKTR